MTKSNRHRGRLAIFTWGYYGWGNATRELVTAVDAVERARGFRPPMFVDIRIQRSVRAAGFNGNAFEKTLGTDRYRWMKGLGNLAIVRDVGRRMRIAEPKAAASLLDLASELFHDRQRLLFYCSCENPRWCHRHAVAGLVLKEAKKRAVPVEVVEWPGGDPQGITLQVSPAIFSAVKRGRFTIPLSSVERGLARFAALPGGSVVQLVAEDDSGYIVTGPARFTRGEWVLNAWDFFSQIEKARQAGETWRQRLGLTARTS
jgi:hypothetical protein